MSATLLGLGTALPAHGVSQAVSAAMSAPLCCTTADEHRLFEVLYRRSRVKSRHSVLLQAQSASSDTANGNGHALEQTFFPATQGENDPGPGTKLRMERYALEAAPLALAAARQALNQAAIEPATIDHLITVSCTGFAAPGVDGSLIQSLGLNPQVSRTNVGFMGCHGAFNGLRIASSLVRGTAERALVCAVELCSLHFAYGWNPQRIVANSLFADGAGAVVVGEADTAKRSATPRAAEGWQLKANGSVMLADSRDAMTWKVTDHGFEMTLSPRVPELIQTHLKSWLESWLARYGLKIEAIGSWAVHPGGPRILQSVEAALSLPAGALAMSHEVLAECGNMSSPTILFILERLRQQGAARPCVALGFGPGLAVEAMLFL